MEEKMVSIGEAARQCGISVRRVRYLSDQGHISKPFISRSGDMDYRLYTKGHIEQIKRIKAFQEQGYTLQAAVQKAKQEGTEWKR